MEENQQQNPEQNAPNLPKPPFPAAEGQNVQQKPNAKTQTEDCRYIQQEPPNIADNIPSTPQEKWSLANKITAWGVAVNIVLALFTYLLFRQSLTQSLAAVKAAKVADSVLTIQNKQFEIQNRPNLAVERVEYIFPDHKDAPLTPGIKREMRFIIYNVGNHTVHAYRYKYYFKFDTTEAAINSIKEVMRSRDSSRNLDVYIPPGRDAFAQNIVFDANPKVEDNEKMKNGVCVFYLEMEYFNDITEKWRTYTLIATLKAKGTPETMINTTLYNVNKDTDLKDMPPPCY